MVPKAPIQIQLVEEIDIDRWPPVYKSPSKYIDVEDLNRPAVVIDLQGVLMYSHHIDSTEPPPDLDANEHIQIEDGPYLYFVRRDAEVFLLLACYFANVFIWSSARIKKVQKRVETLFRKAAPFLSGVIGQEQCEVADYTLPGGKPVFFKNLHDFWRRHPRYSESNTLLIDDSRYKCAINRPGTYLIVPQVRTQDWMLNVLGVWLLKWNSATDRLAFSECRDQLPSDDTDKYVYKKMKQRGGSMTYSAWEKQHRH